MEDRIGRSTEPPADPQRVAAEEAEFLAMMMAIPAEEREAILAWIVDHAEQIKARMRRDRRDDPEMAALRAEAKRRGTTIARIIGEQVAAAEAATVRLTRAPEDGMHAGGEVVYRVTVDGRWVGWVGDGREWRGWRYGGRKWWACWREDGDSAARWSTDLDYRSRRAALDDLIRVQTGLMS